MMTPKKEEEQMIHFESIFCFVYNFYKKKKKSELKAFLFAILNLKTTYKNYFICNRRWTNDHTRYKLRLCTWKTT